MSIAIGMGGEGIAGDEIVIELIWCCSPASFSLRNTKSIAAERSRPRISEVSADPPRKDISKVVVLSSVKSRLTSNAEPIGG
jgi:hypothetical protein